ncbi:hypothetical protein EKO23_07770 [Nocardioides guangzhouensis]|uniref:Uncharacterized protein n=1 Tax=Nocardioides guangzhouensis TaxID=2497878 RepID=A0A4Q4ZFF6_9ACTN|nr:hypothetical protein [Nocardioides guangzhouensis]RYP86862.1 hypothetical protein EKO23_07770 [Nocardioides guangzhouensis]
MDYRTNVVVFLQGYEETWAALALLYVTGDLLLGNVSSEEGARQHRLIGLLTPGWMLQTPLVQRLLALNRADAFDRTDDGSPS